MDRLKTSEDLSHYRRHARARDVYNGKSLQRSSDRPARGCIGSLAPEPTGYHRRSRPISLRALVRVV